MELNTYQKEAEKTAIFPEKYKVVYAALGLGNEAGEVLGKIKKFLRGDDGEKMSEERKEMLCGELGDVLWYLAILARDLDLSLDEIAEKNIAKLRDRQERSTLQGDGDSR